MRLATLVVAAASGASGGLPPPRARWASPRPLSPHPPTSTLHTAPRRTVQPSHREHLDSSARSGAEAGGRVSGEATAPEVFSAAPLDTITVLFVCHDAGESYGLQPVAEQLQLQETTGVTVGVLTLARPATTIFSGFPGAMTLESLGVNVRVLSPTPSDPTAGRTQVLGPSELQVVLRSLPALRVVVVGMVYAMQAQLASAFLRAGRVSVGYWDGFGTALPQGLGQGFLTGAALNQTSPAVSTILTVTQAAAQGFSSVARGKGIDGVTVKAVGSPTLGQWAGAAANTSAVTATRHALYGDNRSTVGVVFAGGYGGSDYNASVTLFAQLVAAANGSAAFAFAPHPGYGNASVERAIFALHNVSNRVTIVPSGVETSTVVAASNASLSGGSSVGVQSLAIGVPSMFLVDEAVKAGLNASWGVVVTAGLLRVATTVESAVALLGEFQAAGWRFDRHRLATAGIPSNATATMTSIVVRLATPSPPSPGHTRESPVAVAVAAGCGGVILCACLYSTLGPYARRYTSPTPSGRQSNIRYDESDDDSEHLLGSL